MSGCQLWELWLETSRVAYSTIVALEIPDRLVGISFQVCARAEDGLLRQGARQRGMMDSSSRPWSLCLRQVVLGESQCCSKPLFKTGVSGCRGREWSRSVCGRLVEYISGERGAGHLRGCRRIVDWEYVVSVQCQSNENASPIRALRNRTEVRHVTAN